MCLSWWEQRLIDQLCHQMKIQDLEISAALTGFHNLSLNSTTIYCDGRNYIPPGLSGLEVDEVYLFKEMNAQRLATGMQYFVAFIQVLQQVQVKYQQYIFTITSALPGQFILTDGTTENTIARIGYLPVQLEGEVIHQVQISQGKRFIAKREIVVATVKDYKKLPV